MKYNLFVIFYALLISPGAAQLEGGEDEDGKCDHNAVVMAMTTCQGERQKLSYASQSNNTVQLCNALLQYSDCMKSKIQGCEGPAKLAFEMITNKYAGEPYNCQLNMSNEVESNSTKQKHNKASAGKETSNDVNTNKSPADKLPVQEPLNNSGDKNEGKNRSELKPLNQNTYTVHTHNPFNNVSTVSTHSEAPHTMVKPTYATNSATEKVLEKDTPDTSSNKTSGCKMNCLVIIFLLFIITLQHI